MTHRGPRPAPEPPSLRRYVPGLGGVRALAAFAVLIHHVGFSTGATFRNSFFGPTMGRLDVGVAVFFVLSGYLLFRPFVAGLATGRMPGTWRSYFVKRFARIYPPLIPALIATAAAKDVLDMSPVEWVVHGTLLQSFVPDWVFDVMSQAWTLTAEVGFYLLLPAFVAALAVRCERLPVRERLKTASRWSLGLVVLSWLFNVLMLNSGWEHRFLGVIWLPGQLDQFALGMLIAVADVRGQFDPWFKARLRRVGSPTVVWWGAALAGVWAMSEFFDFPEALQETSGLNWAGIHALRSLVGLLMVAPIVFGPPGAGPIRAAMSSRIGDWLGNLSYGIYLWHLAILEFALDQMGYELFQAPFWPVLGVVVGISIIVAAASWYGLERPILRWVGSSSASTHTATPDTDLRWAHDPAGMGGRVLGPEYGGVGLGHDDDGAMFGDNAVIVHSRPPGPDHSPAVVDASAQVRGAAADLGAGADPRSASNIGAMSGSGAGSGSGPLSGSQFTAERGSSSIGATSPPRMSSTQSGAAPVSASTNRVETRRSSTAGSPEPTRQERRKGQSKSRRRRR